MNQPKRYLITSALPYANGLKHIGHLAGAYLPADIYVRYLKAKKLDVVFVCGSDEHGTAIPIQATKEGTTARAIIDKYHPIMKQNFKDMGIDFDIYHRTSDPLHKETAQEFFTKLNNNGDIEVKETEQYFDDLGVKCIDLTERLREEKKKCVLYNPIDAHLNPYGNEIAAQEIAHVLAEWGYVKPTKSEYVYRNEERGYKEVDKPTSAINKPREEKSTLTSVVTSGIIHLDEIDF